MAKSIDELEARLAVLSIALQELCRALSAKQAEQVATALQDRVAQLPPLNGGAAGELAALLAAPRS